MFCLLLGGGGFIGSALADKLLELGHRVRIFERPRIVLYRNFGLNESIEWVSGDYLSSADIREAMQDIDIVFHLISTTLPKNSNDDPIYDIETNLVGTLKLLNLSVELAVKKIIFISSGGTVYGIPQQIPIPESHPTNPLVSYGIGKLAIEKYLYLFNIMKGLNYVVLRVANPFGERQRTNTAQGVVPVFLKKAINKDVIQIWGDGSIIRDYVYISDVTDAFIKAMDYKGDSGIFNIGSGHGYSINDILIEIEKLLGYQVTRQYLPSRQFDVPINILNITNAKEILSWQPRINFRYGLEKTLLWLKNYS